MCTVAEESNVGLAKEEERGVGQLAHRLEHVGHQAAPTDGAQAVAWEGLAPGGSPEFEADRPVPPTPPTPWMCVELPGAARCALRSRRSPAHTKLEPCQGRRLTVLSRCTATRHGCLNDLGAPSRRISERISMY